jgi:uncharacterized membrane protein YeaQ/YmgE (transglycosylase-associated protein family)
MMRWAFGIVGHFGSVYLYGVWEFWILKKWGLKFLKSIMGTEPNNLLF